MNELPASWVIQHRAGLWSRLILAYGALLRRDLQLEPGALGRRTSTRRW